MLLSLIRFLTAELAITISTVALEDQDWEVQQAAAEALEKIRQHKE